MAYRAFLAVAGSATMLTASAASPQPADLAGWIAGPPQRCIDLKRIRGTELLGDAILFKRSSVQYLSQSPGCPAPKIGSKILSGGGSLCTGDVVTVVDSGTRIVEGTCRVGEFVPYRRK